MVVQHVHVASYSYFTIVSYISSFEGENFISSGRGAITLMAIVVAVALALLLRRQRFHASAARQIANVSTYLARFNQISNDVPNKSELLTRACDLAITEGGFSFAAALEVAGGNHPIDDLSTIYRSAEGSDEFLKSIESIVLQALDSNETLFLRVDTDPAKNFFGRIRKLFDRRTTVVLPLNLYFRSPSAIVLVTRSRGQLFPGNQLIRELTVELGNDLMRASHRIDLIKRDLEISALNESLLGSLGVGINVVRYPERVIEIANERILEIAGAKDLGEFKATPAQELYSSEEEYQRVGEFAKVVLENGYGSMDAVGYRTFSGEPVFLDMSGRVLDLGDGVVRIVWTQIDVTDRVEADRQRNELSHLRDVLLNNTVAGIDLVEYPERKIIESNLAFAAMFGYDSVEEVIGLHTSTLYTIKAENDRMLALVNEIFANGEGGIRDLQAVKKDGSTIFLDIHGRLLADGGSANQVIVWTSVDVTERHQLNDELRRHANFDSLTNLPNRRALHQYLVDGLARARAEGNYLAVCVIDLDDFKPVNDAYGHPAGDELLKEFSNRLRLALRTGDFASRLGGDEFIVILEGLDVVTIETQLESVLSRLHNTVETSFQVEGHFLVTVGMSMGISFSNGGIDEPDTLVRMADSAMYAIKKRKGDRKQWWMIADSKLDSQDLSWSIDLFGSEVNTLLDGFKSHILIDIDGFVSQTYVRLIHQGAISKNFIDLPPSDLDKVKDLQVRSLICLLDGAIDLEHLKEISAQLGTDHAYIGTSSSALVEIANLYRDFIDASLDTMAIRPIDRLLVQSAIEERLKLYLQIQLEAMDRSIDSYLALLADPFPTNCATWHEAMEEAIDSIASLPGILGGQLWRQNLEGVFSPEINKGEIRDSIDQIVLSSTAPRLDTRADTGSGMVTIATLTGEIAFSNSFATDPRTAPWQKLLVPRGVSSIVAIPLISHGSRSGVLVLHGAFPNQFSSKWISSFLTELRQRLVQIIRSYDSALVSTVEGNGIEYRKLLYSGSLKMYGQPIVEVASGKVVKVELLARMILSDGSIAPPSAFMPSLNQADLDTLFLQGLDRALQQMQEWDRQGLSLSVSLNIAASTVLNSQSNQWIRQRLESFGIEPFRLTLELVEDQDISGETHADAVRSLSKIGVRLAIDDLGSGYSSLKRLASLPFDVIKIDQSIVRSLRYDPISNLSLIRTMIQIGADFDRYVIVEGVEDAAEIEAVRRLGALYVQGYGVARPMPLEDIYSWTTSDPWSPGDGRRIGSFLGALAYHMSYLQFDSAGGDLEVGDCPVTQFLKESGFGDSEPMMWHGLIHGGGDDLNETKRANRSFLDWLAAVARDVD